MLDPLELLRVAQQLSASTDPASQRRAVSTAYYALFHAVLRSGADRFVGPSDRDTPGYAIVYRSFAHGRMKEVCRDIDKANLSDSYRDTLQRPAVSPSMRWFATAFVESQNARHRADYDPQAVFGRSDAERACTLAQFGMTMLSAADPDELRDVLALMLGNIRR